MNFSKKDYYLGNLMNKWEFFKIFLKEIFLLHKFIMIFDIFLNKNFLIFLTYYGNFIKFIFKGI